MSAKTSSIVSQCGPNSLFKYLTVVCLFLGTFSAIAASQMTPTLCNQLLAGGTTITAKRIFDELARIASERFAAHRAEFGQDSYAALTEEIVEGKTQHSLPGAFDSTWALSLPAPENNIWLRLDSKVRLEVLDLLEKAFYEGEYDLTLLGPSHNEGSKDAFSRILNQPTFQALRSRNGHPVGFSPVLFLGAALSGFSVGICRHSNLAMAGILVELGIPPEDLRIITGFPSPEEHSAGHLFLEIRASDDLPWLTYDATGSASIRGAQAHNPSYFEPSGSMSREKESTVNTLVTTRLLLNSMKGLREQFKYNQIVHTEFSSPDKPIPPEFFDIVRTPPESDNELGKTISELFDKGTSSDHSPGKMRKFIISIDDGSEP